MPSPSRSVVVHSQSTPTLAERVLRELDQRPASVVVSLAAILVVGPDARTVVAAMHHSFEIARVRSDALALTLDLARLGERNVGVAIVRVLLRPDTAETWPPSAAERWLVADVAAVHALARFLELVEAFAPAKRATSNLERFAQALGRGLEPDHAAAVATGRVQ